MKDANLFDRLFDHYSVDSNGCHIWNGQTDGKSNPYGRTSFKGQTIAAHLAMWRAIHGRPRKGYEIDHKCAVRLCVNIAHLQMVTSQKNQRLRVKRANLLGDIQACLAVK